MSKMEMPVSGRVEEILKTGSSTCNSCASCPKFIMYGLDEISYRGTKLEGAGVVAYCLDKGTIITSGLQKTCSKLYPPKPEFPTRDFVISTFKVPSDSRISRCLPGADNCKHFGIARTKNGHFVAACFKDLKAPVPLTDEVLSCVGGLNCLGAKQPITDGLKLIPNKE